MSWHSELDEQYRPRFRHPVSALRHDAGDHPDRHGDLRALAAGDIQIRARYAAGAAVIFIRRIVIAVIVIFIITASVVQEFSSLATFAGLITAGVAVASCTQTVILSGVAYFFFIGRFGMRVGDRVTISGITGDVIEIGLFRIYLLELGGVKSDLHATGRVVVFSNSVLFAPTAFYKQMPGSDYIWHEVALTLAPDSDHILAEHDSGGRQPRLCGLSGRRRIATPRNQQDAARQHR